MDSRQLRKLNRSELLNVLLLEAEENQKQKQQLREQEKQLHELEKQAEDKKLALDNAGSIAEASMALNGIFESAQKTADQYLENISRMEKQKQAELEEAQKKAEQIVTEAQERAEHLVMEAKATIEDLVNEEIDRRERAEEPMEDYDPFERPRKRHWWQRIK